MSELPEALQVGVVDGPVRGTVSVPGSKSFTNRALPVAALARGRSCLRGALDSEDTQVMIASLRQLGIEILDRSGEQVIEVEGCAGSLPNRSAELFLANSGTSIRFLTALVALGEGTYMLDGVERMRERPIGPLLQALNQLGVNARAVHQNDCPPVTVHANGLPGGEVVIRGDVSSQFLSALLMVAPLARGPLTVRVEGPLVSVPYIDMTLATMQAFGAQFERDDHREFRFSGGQGYRGAEYAIEPDASAASYFFGVAAVTGGEVTVPGLGLGALQGDLGFVRELEKMGCRVTMTADATTVQGGQLHGIDTDLCDLSDTVPTLAAVACFADTPTTIRGVEHVRRKETDRLAALATELRKTGAGIQEHVDGLTITPAPLQPAAFDTYKDHRMAMSLSLIGLRVAGVIIRDPGCTVKTYPQYFTDLSALTGEPFRSL